MIRQSGQFLSHIKNPFINLSAATILVFASVVGALPFVGVQQAAAAESTTITTNIPTSIELCGSYEIPFTMTSHATVDDQGTMVRARTTVLTNNASQFESWYKAGPGESDYLPITYTGNVAYFGAGAGFPLTDGATSEFKVIFNTPDVYTFVTELVSVADGSTVGIPIERDVNVTSCGELVSIDPYFVKSTYKGFAVDIKVDNITDATGVEVRVDRENGGPVVKTAKDTGSILPTINTAGTVTFTAPIVIQQGTYNEAGSSSWNQPTATWDHTTKPTAVTVTITRAIGATLTMTKTIDQFATPFATLDEVMPVDVTAPAVEITSIVRNSDGTYTVTGTTDDAADVTLTIAGPGGVTASKSVAPVGGVWTVTTDKLADGNYEFVATSEDSAGNIGTSAPKTLQVKSEVGNSTTNPPVVAVLVDAIEQPQPVFQSNTPADPEVDVAATSSTNTGENNTLAESENKKSEAVKTTNNKKISWWWLVAAIIAVAAALYAFWRRRQVEA